MSWTSLILRSALIGLTVLQAVLLPRGGCCCAAQRLMAVVSGDHSGLPACCRIADSRAERLPGDRQPCASEPSGSEHGKCQCIATVCGAPQNDSHVTLELGSFERLNQWEVSQPVLVAAVTVLPVRLTFDVRERNLPRLCSGHDARIVLQSWRC